MLVFSRVDRCRAAASMVGLAYEGGIEMRGLARGLGGDCAEGRQVSAQVATHTIVAPMSRGKMLRRHFLLSTPLLTAARVHAQAWPNGRVTEVVPFPAGAATDISARVYAERLSALWGQPVAIDNKRWRQRHPCCRS